MIIDQLFEDDKKKKLNEIDPRNYDSDEDYYNDLYGDEGDDEEDFDVPDDDVSNMDNDEESYYEKYVRTKNLEGYETTPFGRVSNTTPNYSQAWKVTDEGEEFLRKAYQRLKRAYEEEGQVGMINIGPALSELQQQKFGPAYVQQSGPYQMMTTDISRLIEKIEPWQKQYGQQHLARDFDPEDFSNWNKQQGMSENTSRKVDAKGLTQGEWMQAVKQKFPDAKIVQAKMIDGPAHALLSDGRKIVWNPVQGVAEVGQNFRRGNARRAALNAMSPEERKAHEDKRAEQQRKRDEARLERERQRNAAKKGVAVGNLKEFAPGGNSASSYYAVTANFVDDFAQQKQEELQDLIDAGWTKQDLAQAGTLEGNASDIAHFEQVRDGFLKGLKPGFDAYLQGDTQLKDQLGAYWMENDLPLNQDWEKIYGEPWGDDGEFNEGVAEGSLNEFSMGDDGEDPTDNYPCYDCGSTIFLHHTKLCDLAEDNAIRDLPAKPGSQHWTGQIPKGLNPIPGLQEGVAEDYDTAEDYRAKAQWLRSEFHLSPDEAWERAYDTDPDTWVGSPWEDDYKQGMAEAKASTAAFRASNAKRAKLNAMSPEERKEYDKEQAEKQRKRDDARLEKDRQKLAAKKGLSESRRLNEAMLMEDPIYRKFKGVGRYIAEQKLTEPEILQIFSNAETGMTDKGTGANRTFLGRGKDTTVDFAKDVAGAVNEVLNSIQNSTPVAAVDVAYDQATDALANLTGGQKGAVMGAINKYRNLVKQYPKTAGFAKAALVAIAGLATGGAGLPAIAGLTYALDSAIKGDKLSSVLGKGAGTAALAAAGQGIFGGASQTGAADTNAFTNVNQMGDYTGEYVSMPDPTDSVAGLTADPTELATYTVQQGDTLSQIADANGTTVQELIGLNPHLAAGTGATGGQSMNPDVLFPGDQITLPPATGADVYTGGVGTNANTMADIARGQVPNSAITQGMAARNAVKESIKYRARILPANKLIDQKATVLNWALSESVGRRSRSVNLTTIGTYTVFENIDRYRQALLEYAGDTQPGRPELPDQYAPAMPGGAGVPSKPGLIGRGLNYLDRGVKKVGGALSNFGHQFTTNVTKEKLKMNWHQDGKPSDSDQLAAWLVKQGVPQEVVTSVYGKMSIPYTAPATTQPAGQTDAQAAAPKTGTAQRLMPFNNINPKTGQRWTVDDLEAERNPQATAAPDNTAPAPTATKTTAGGPAGFNAGNVMSLPGMEKYAKKAATPPAKTPNFAGPSGYSKVTQSFKTPGAVAPTATNVTSTYGPGFKNSNQPEPQGTTLDLDQFKKDQAAKQDFAKSGYMAPAMTESRIAAALKRPVAEMLQMVETKEDVQKIKQFVDQTFTRYGAVSESAFVVRNQILEHVTQAGAQRRREHSRKAAH